MEKTMQLIPIPASAQVGRRTSEEMFPLIESQQSSGLTQRQFCEESGIAPHIFAYWLRKYRESQNLDSGFLPLKLPNSTSPSSIRLVVSSGHRFEFSDQVSPAWVAGLIRELS